MTTARRLVRAALAVVGTIASFASAYACPSPLLPGRWKGELTIGVTTRIVDNRGQVVATGSGQGGAKLSLKVACDGSVSGTIAELNGFETIRARGLSTTCTATGTLKVLGGRVALAGGRVELDLTSDAEQFRVVCSGPLAGLTGLAVGGAPPGTRVEHVLVSDQAPARRISGTTWTYTVGGVSPIAPRRNVQTEVRMQWWLQGEGPVVLTLAPSLTRIFFAGIARVPVTLGAVVDWGGAAKPGSVVTFKDAQGDFDATVPANADAVVSPSFDADRLAVGTHTFSAVAKGPPPDDEASDPVTTALVIVRVPPWAAAAALAVTVNATNATYAGKLRNIPSPGFEKLIAFPRSLPLLGDSAWGLRATSFDLGLAADSLGGPRTGAITGRGGLAFGTNTYDWQISGTTKTTLADSGWTFDAGTASFRIPAPPPFEKRIQVVSLLPAALTEIPVVGGYLSEYTSLFLVVRFFLAGAGDAEFGVLPAAPDVVAVTKASVTVGPRVSVDAVIGGSLLRASVGGAASAVLTFDLVPTPALKTCTGRVELRISLVAGPWSRTFPWELPVDCPGGGADLREPGRRAPTKYALAARRGRAGADDPLVAPLRVRARAPDWSEASTTPTPRAAGSESEVVLVGPGGFPDPHPALAAAAAEDGAPSTVGLAWVAERKDLPRQRASEVRVRFERDSAWGEPVAVTSDQRPDTEPTLAFDGAGKALVAWTTHPNEALPDDVTLTPAYARAIEIAWASVDPTTRQVLAQGRLTTDDALDLAPVLVRASDGTVWAAWERSADGTFAGSAGAPKAIVTARWNGASWSEPEVVPLPLVGARTWSLAATDAERALIASDQDVDGDPKTDADREIVVVAREGSGWGSPRALTRDAIADRGPVAVMGDDGAPVVAWLAGDHVAVVRGALEAAQAASLLGDGGDHALAAALAAGGGLRLVAGAGGELALLVPGVDGLRVVRSHDGGARWDAAAQVAADGRRGLLAGATVTAKGDLACARVSVPPAGPAGSAAEQAAQAEVGVVRVAAGLGAPRVHGSAGAGGVPLVVVAAIGGAVALTVVIVLVVVVRRRRVRRG